MKIVHLKSSNVSVQKRSIARTLLVVTLLVSLSLAPLSWAAPEDQEAPGPNWIDQLVTWVAQWAFGSGDLEEPTQEDMTFLDPTTTEAQTTEEDEADRGVAIDPHG